MTTEIYRLMNKVMEDVGAVSKDQRNQHQNFNFRGIDAVVNAVSPALKRHGIVVIPRLIEKSYEIIEVGSKRTVMGHCQVIVEYVFAAPDGSNIAAKVAAESMDSGDKATAKAMSVAFRTALLQTLCLPTDETDPDHEIFERSSRQAPPQPPSAMSFEERVHKFRQLCELEGFSAEKIMSIAGINEITEDNLPQLRETFKTYKMTVEASEQQRAQADGIVEVADAVKNVAKAFNIEGNAVTSHKMASEPQIKKLHVMYKNAGYDQLGRLEHASSTVGVTIASFNDLTSRQASALIEKLSGN
jgi:hypothetical protein